VIDLLQGDVSGRLGENALLMGEGCVYAEGNACAARGTDSHATGQPKCSACGTAEENMLRLCQIKSCAGK
jgi:hypothetical protein